MDIKIPVATATTVPSQRPAVTANKTTNINVTSLPALTGDQNNPILLATRQSILALQQMQEQTAELHRLYLEGQQAAQQSIQQLIEQQQQLLSGLPVNYKPTSVVPQITLPAQVSETTQKLAVVAPTVTAPTAATSQLESILLQVIAEKTGYPVEMLSMEMSLDTDLGIDSIKRVEILSGLQEKLPGIRKIAPEDLGTFRLLENIIEYLSADQGHGQASVPQQELVNVADTVLQQNLLDVVAEKTGYPVDMLRLDMNLDTDLGIDSIKRVEILSAFQERTPNAPTVNPEDMASLQTLQQILGYMQVSSNSNPVISTAIATKPASSAFNTTLLEVVAEKTGYPVDMLRLDMNLDTDLGIDSIKRVEILSAFQERMPNAPTVDPEHMATLQTLQQIVNYMQSNSIQSDTITSIPVLNQSSTHAFDQTLLEVVAEKTGYPVDMLRLDMNLDTGLGIDSIKRVEILSAFQERMPDAPTVNPDDMAVLQTLQQIIDYMHKGRPQTIPAQNKPVLQPAPNLDVVSLWRGVVTLTSPETTASRARLILPAGSAIHVTQDGDGLANSICKQLNTQGYTANVIDIHDKQAGTLAGLVIIAPAHPDKDFIIHAFELIQFHGTALKQAANSHAALLAGITRLGGSFGLDQLSDSDPVTGGLAGLIKTADKEWSQIRCRAIDTDYTGKNADTIAVAVVGELLHEGPLETGLAGNQRKTLTLLDEPLALKTGKALVIAGDVIVISGGARGVTAEIAVEIAAEFRTNLLLLGRSPAPASEPAWLQMLFEETEIKRAIVANSPDKPAPKQIELRYREIIAAREIRQTLERTSATGVKVSYRQVDIRDTAEVRRILAETRSELGQICGLVHGAGVLADRRIEDKTREQFREVWSTKVAGLQALLGATANDDLKLMVLFSSSTGRFGRKGQIDYAAANEVLNKIAQQQLRQRPGCRVISVNWGPWDGGMVTPELKKVFESEGVGVIPLRAGAKYLMDEIKSQGPVELVILGSAPAEIATHTPATASEMTITFERTISIEDMPVLEAHVLNGKSVLPAALIIEWLVHGAMHNNPGLSFNGMDKLTIFKGVILDTGSKLDLQILAGNAFESAGQHLVPVELRQGKLLHAGGNIILGTDSLQSAAASNPVINGAYSIADDSVYTSTRLFHGQQLQGIQTIAGYSESGISANVRPAPHPSAWMKQPIRTGWLADPLALDSAFQLMILWCFEKTGTASLPTRIGQYRQFRRNFPKDGVQINLQVDSVSKHQARASIEFIDMKGKLVARIDDYECVLDTSLNEAFKRNRLETEPQA